MNQKSKSKNISLVSDNLDCFMKSLKFLLQISGDEFYEYFELNS